MKTKTLSDLYQELAIEYQKIEKILDKIELQTGTIEFAPWNMCDGIMADIRYQLEVPKLEA